MENMANNRLAVMVLPADASSLSNTVVIISDTSKDESLVARFQAEHRNVATDDSGLPTIQIPTSILTDLTTTTNALKLEVALLRSAKAHLANQLSKFHQDSLKMKGELMWTTQQCGPTFACFARLPAEVRTMIWQMYLKLPQIVCYGRFPSLKQLNARVGEAEVLRSANPHSHLLRVCREARAQTMKVQKQYGDKGGVHFNQELDTVWLPDLVPEDFGCYMHEFAQRSQTIVRTAKLPYLATSYQCWHANFADVPYTLDMMNNITNLGVQKLFLVVSA